MGQAESADLLCVKHASSMLVPLGHGDECLSLSRHLSTSLQRLKRTSIGISISESPNNLVRKWKLRNVNDQLAGMRGCLPPGPFLYSIVVKHVD